MAPVNLVASPQGLWDAISEESQYEGAKSLQIVPDLTPLDGFEGVTIDGNSLIQINNESANRTEVFIAKQKLVELCVFAVRHLDKVLEGNSDLQTWSAAKLQAVFLTTVVLLVASPENHTAVAIHRDILCVFYKSDPSIVAKEYTFLTTILTCNNSRTNKSSSLWHLLRQICLLRECRHKLFETILNSALVHQNNYYAWSFARFLIRVEWFAGTQDMAQYYEQTLKFCKNMPQDTSAWTFLRDLQMLEITDGDRTMFEGQVRGYLSGFEVKPLDCSHRLGRIISQNTVYSDILALFDWIEKMEVVSYNPWLCMLPYLSESPLLPKIRQRVKQYESRYGVIKLVNGHHIHSTTDLSDIIMVRRCAMYANMKRVLAWVERIQ